VYLRKDRWVRLLIDQLLSIASIIIGCCKCTWRGVNPTHSLQKPTDVLSNWHSAIRRNMQTKQLTQLCEASLSKQAREANPNTLQCRAGKNPMHLVLDAIVST